MANILMMVTQFAARGSPADPPRQLADAFVKLGHSVKVIVVPWQHTQNGVETYSEHDRLQILRVPPIKAQAFGRIFSLLMRWTFSSWRARRHAKAFIGDCQIDFVYATSPAVTMAFLIRWARRRFRASSYLYVVDFFPYHQRAIGLVPRGPVFDVAMSQENALMRMFDVIGCMTPRNVEFLRRNYTLAQQQRVEVLPLSTGIRPITWIDKVAGRDRYGLPQDKIIAIFGGQITEGRGIEEIVMAARLASEEASDLYFVLVGQGRLAYLPEAYMASGGQNLLLRPNLTRDDYLDLASLCDIGLVATVPIADIPTFPSKTLDYLQASLPVVAAVEKDTDFRDFVAQRGFGIIVDAGDAPALLKALKRLARDSQLRHDMASAGRRTLHDVFDVNNAARQITKSMRNSR